MSSRSDRARLRRAALLVFGLALLLLAGCGYQLANKRQPTVLPVIDGQELASLAIDKVVNPTVDPSLEYRLRGMLRDELTSRGLAVWEDRDQAQARMNLTIHHLLSRGGVKDEKDRTLKFYLELAMSAELRRSKGETFWRSGVITTSWSYTDEDESAALTQVLTLAVRQLADRLTQAY